MGEQSEAHGGMRMVPVQPAQAGDAGARQPAQQGRPQPQPQEWPRPQQEWAPRPQAQPGPQLMPQPSASSLALCQDGKYRWAYELGLFSNPTILFLIWRIFAGIGVGMWLLMFVLAVVDNGGDVIGTAGDFAEGLPVALIGLVAMLAITGLGYAAYALMNGGRYCVAFEMDDEGVTHRQMPSQVRKAEVVGMINVLAGVASGNPAQVGVGLTSARSEMRSDFRAVRSVVGDRRRGVIKVNEPLAKNQVYAEPQDYDFVWRFITSRCPGAKVTDR